MNRKIKKKSYMDLLRESRNQWTINPATRVKESRLKDKKLLRRNAKKEIKEYMDET